jgi:S1-C subfamily serine protease
VERDGPAWQQLAPAGSARTDVIVGAEGRPVRSEAELREAIGQPGPGGIVSLDVLSPGDGEVLRRIVRLRVGQ